MRPSEILALHKDEILERFEKHPKLSNLRVFGSVARGEDTEESDIDFLIEAAPDASLFDIGRFCSDLMDFFGENFDLIEDDVLPDKFKTTVLKEAITL